MSNVVWNLGSDGLHSPQEALFDALGTGVILGGSTSSFTMKDGPEVVIFQGNFTLTNGAITSGTISGFRVFYNSPADKLMDVTGYSIDFSAFKQALATAVNSNNPGPRNHLLFDNSMTVNGANQALGSETMLGGFAGDHLNGNGGSDNIGDLGGSDIVHGGAGNDVIVDDATESGGLPGGDFLFGDDGDDIIGPAGSITPTGGGNDSLSGGQGKDELDGGPGSDTADYSEKLDTVVVVLNGPNNTHVLVGGFAEDTIRNIENVNSGKGDDTITGDGLINRLIGNAGDDTLRGMDGNDVLGGRDGNDRIFGGHGGDQVNGGLGNDRLKGGPNTDTFLFDSVLGASNVDKIKDLRGADHIALDVSIFAGLPLGALKAKFFHAGSKATDGNDHVIYDKAAGKLFFDEDGKGDAHQVLFAKIFDHGSHHPTLHAGDLLVI